MRNLVISPNITVREYKSLDRYFNEIEKISPIAIEEEVMLAEKIRQGDLVALERLTKANLRFVISVAKQYQHLGLTLGDLINEGNMGLITAAKRYDETRGFKFISYAVWWIRQSIIGALAEHSRTMRLPYNKHSLLTKLCRASNTLEQEYSRKPTAAEVAAYLGLAEFKVSELLERSGAGISLYDHFINSEDLSVIEVLQYDDDRPDEKVMYESIKAEIKYSMRVLSHRERNIVMLYFGLGASPAQRLEEIAGIYDITKEHVHRLKEKALKKLRNSTSAPVLLSCLN